CSSDLGAVTVRRFGFELMPAGATPSRTGIRGAWHGRPAPGDDSRYPVARGRVAGRCPLRAWAPTGARDGKQRRPVRRWRAANFAPAPAGAGQGGSADQRGCRYTLHSARPPSEPDGSNRLRTMAIPHRWRLENARRTRLVGTEPAHPAFVLAALAGGPPAGQSWTSALGSRTAGAGVGSIGDPRRRTGDPTGVARESGTSLLDSDRTPSMDETTDRRLRLLRAIALASIFIGGTIDVVLDQSPGLLRFHILYELLMIVGAAVMALTLWWGWWQAEWALGQLRQRLEAQRAENDAWRKTARKALRGLGEVIAAKFNKWQLTPAEREV